MLIIAGEITSKRALEARSKLFNIASTRRVLKLLIDSPGGEVNAGMGLYDALQAVAADVETGCVGQAHSIASLLLACGRRGKRWCAASCSVSLHWPTSSAFGSADCVLQHASSALEARALAAKAYMKHCDRRLAEVEEAMSAGTCASAWRAAAWGLVDRVV